MKTKTLKLNIACVFLASLVIFLSVTSSVYAEAVTKEDIIILSNQERKKAGLSELKENPLLSDAAMKKAEDMVGNNYFAHTSPAGLDPWHWFGQVGYQYKYAGENLAMDFTSSTSVTRAWMKSPTHRENIMSDKFQEIGVAVLTGIVEEKETQVAVQMFGTQLGQLANSTQSNEKPLSIKIEEASIYPWKGKTEDEMLVYAQIEGEPAKVEATIGDKSFDLLKHREGTYMNLLLLSEIDVEKNPVLIKASEDEKRFVSYEISQSQVKETINHNNTQPEQPMIASATPVNNSFIKSLLKQNIFLSVGLVLFLIVIANIWILEKEEEELIAAQQAAA